jgi:hypothetical protein
MATEARRELLHHFDRERGVYTMKVLLGRAVCLLPRTPWNLAPLLIVLGIGVYLTSAREALAYNLLGGRWANSPTSGCCLYVSFKNAATYSGLATAYDSAKGDWNTSSANVNFKSPGATGISGEVWGWDVHDSSVGWSGLTRLFNSAGQECYGSSCRWTDADVFLNHYYTQNYTDSAKKKGLASHELGHAIGLAHAGGCVIMVDNDYSRWNVCGVHTPQADDRNGVNALY